MSDLVTFFKAAWSQAISVSAQSTDAELEIALRSLSAELLRGSAALTKQAIERALTLQSSGLILRDVDGRIALEWPNPAEIVSNAMAEAGVAVPL